MIADAMDLDAGHISVSSPLGLALMGHKVGARTKVRLPFGERKLKIEKLRTIHEQVEQQGKAPE